MKKSILCFTLLLAFSFGCNKGSEPQVIESQFTIDKPNDAQSEDRFICCCDVIVTSTAFGGLTICGVNVVGPNPGNPCSISTTCGNTCGVEQVVPQPNKNATFCYETNCPVCFTNNAGFPIQIRLSCAFGSSGTIDFLANETRCFTSDCDGNLTECF